VNHRRRGVEVGSDAEEGRDRVFDLRAAQRLYDSTVHALARKVARHWKGQVLRRGRVRPVIHPSIYRSISIYLYTYRSIYLSI